MTVLNLERLLRAGVVSALDFHFAGLLARLAGTDAAELLLAAALVSRATGQGHVCCDLAALARKELLAGDAGGRALACPSFASWCEALRSASVVGRPGDYCPLILDDRGRLYLYRYWAYENEVAAFIRGSSSETVGGLDRELLRDGLDRYFPENGGAEPDWQKLAAETAVARNFCVISGGPGTGKTTTVAKVLALLVEQAGSARLRLALAAPTGKAAARLEEAIGAARQRLAGPQSIRDAIPAQASTLHRLLGTIPGSPYFRHDARNPLAVDGVIVDEASMVDLALMAKLVRALPPAARLILLGDKDQLASVEAGAVLGDICNTGRETAEENAEVPAVAQCIVELRKSYRFGGVSGIGAVSRAIQAGDSERALTVLRDCGAEDATWSELPRPEALAGALRDKVVRSFGSFLQAPNFAEMIAAFESFRILCALRQGPYGVVAINQLVEAILREARLIQAGQWYRGRPLMIAANDYHLKLFNGDIGIILPDDRAGAVMDPDAGRGAAQPTMVAFFPSSDGPPRRFPPARLPAHETVYAMTVHKSQGSEFDEVLLLLSDRESPVLTRELLYTGVTRARCKVSLWGRTALLRSAVATRIQRSSGLRDAIWGA